MNLAGLFEPTLIFDTDDCPGAFALGHHDRDEFARATLRLVTDAGIFAGYGLEAPDPDDEDDISDVQVHVGSFVLTEVGRDWHVEPVGNGGPALTDPFDGTIASVAI